MDLGAFIQQAILVLIPMILSLTVHEYAHAWASRRLGDTTAEARGRLNLNPLSHIDPVGTVLLPLAILFMRSSTVAGAGFVPFFGWAKPVPVDASRFTRRITVRTGMMLVAAAGPLSNLLLGLLCAALLSLALRMGLVGTLGEPGWSLLGHMVSINVALMVFNLIPVYPLDGQKVLSGLLPPAQAVRYERFNYQYGTFLLMAVIFLGYRIIDIPFRIVITGIRAVVGL